MAGEIRLVKCFANRDRSPTLVNPPCTAILSVGGRTNLDLLANDISRGLLGLA
jgi:hypothetical protein